ncbi:MAG TPA: hypothetical protein VMR02_05665 [Terracidiphilus sp.]|nr:hypothetical protein [Terracidiphilus sp.]
MLSNILELRTKMITGFVLVALITAVVGMIALRSMSIMAQADQRLWLRSDAAHGPLLHLTIPIRYARRPTLAVNSLIKR